MRKNRNYRQHIIAGIRNFDGGDLFPLVMGWFNSRGDFEYEQISQHYCIHLILDGCGVMVADGREYEVKAGDAFMFFPSMHVHYYDYPDKPWEYYWLHFDGTMIEKVLEKSGFSPETPHQTDCPLERIRDFGKGFYNALSSGSIFAAHRGMWELFEILESRRNVELPHEPLALRVKNLLDSLEMNIPNVNELADYFKVDRSTLYRAFKRRYGVSLKDYMEQLKLRKACTLLEHSLLSGARIAELCGYATAQYFSNAFKSAMKATPMAYRKAKMKDRG